MGVSLCASYCNIKPTLFNYGCLSSELNHKPITFLASVTMVLSPKNCLEYIEFTFVRNLLRYYFVSMGVCYFLKKLIRKKKQKFNYSILKFEFVLLLSLRGIMFHKTIVQSQNSFQLLSKSKFYVKG